MPLSLALTVAKTEVDRDSELADRVWLEAPLAQGFRPPRSAGPAVLAVRIGTNVMVRRTRSRFWRNFTECRFNDSKRISQADGTQFALGRERLITSADETGHIDLSRARRARAACGRRLVLAPDADSNSNRFAKSATAANADSGADAASSAAGTGRAPSL